MDKKTIKDFVKRHKRKLITAGVITVGFIATGLLLKSKKEGENQADGTAADLLSGPNTEYGEWDPVTGYTEEEGQRLWRIMYDLKEDQQLGNPAGEA